MPTKRTNNQPDALPAMRESRRWSPLPSDLIAALALVVSIITAAVTFPVVSNWYTKPQLVLTEVDTFTAGPTFRLFAVRNEGWATANSVQVALVVGKDDAVDFNPKYGGKIRTEESGPHTANQYIEIPILNRHEAFRISIKLGPDPPNPLPEQLRATWSSIRMQIIYLRSNEATGELRTKAAYPGFLAPIS